MSERKIIQIAFEIEGSYEGGGDTSDGYERGGGSTSSTMFALWSDGLITMRLFDRKKEEYFWEPIPEMEIRQ